MRTRRPCLLSASRRGVFSGDKGYNTGESATVNTPVRKIRESGRPPPENSRFDGDGLDKIR
jgi:hypothetical protein